MNTIKQDTVEWLEFRKNHIGASDAPIILGVSPWKTPLQLWEEKLGISESPEMNFAMKRGKELESVALEAYNNHTGNFSEPEVVIHPTKKWMMASLDGISIDRSIAVEIKCPGIIDHQLAKEGTIPDKYYPQLQHQLAVLGLPMMHYFSFNDGDFCLIEVERDDEYIKTLYKKEEAFYNQMLSFESPSMTDRDYVERVDSEWEIAANEWMDISEQLSNLREKEKLARDRLIQLANDRPCKGAGISLQKVTRKGSVNYKSIPELSEVDLEMYRGNPVSMWRFSC